MYQLDQSTHMHEMFYGSTCLTAHNNIYKTTSFIDGQPKAMARQIEMHKGLLVFPLLKPNTRMASILGTQKRREEEEGLGC